MIDGRAKRKKASNSEGATVSIRLAPAIVKAIDDIVEGINTAEPYANATRTNFCHKAVIAAVTKRERETADG